MKGDAYTAFISKTGDVAIKSKRTGVIMVPLRSFLAHRNGDEPDEQAITAFENVHTDLSHPALLKWAQDDPKVGPLLEKYLPTCFYSLNDMRAYFPTSRWLTLLETRQGISVENAPTYPKTNDHESKKKEENPRVDVSEERAQQPPRKKKQTSPQTTTMIQRDELEELVRESMRQGFVERNAEEWKEDYIREHAVEWKAHLVERLKRHFDSL